MVDPLTALLYMLVFLFVLSVLFWPEKGLIARWKWSKETSKKVLMEDALKHIYNCEEENITCSYTSLAGALSRDTNQITPIISRLESLGLLILDGSGFQLTEAGRSYALRIIRVHRLWERYLSEETGVPETSWHEEAERKEHLFSEEEANDISRKLGYPRYDPHGDPIPTVSGDLPPIKGRNLSDFSKGDIVKVIQIEDEPPAVYAALIRKNIHLDVYIEIKKIEKSRFHLFVDGKEQIISSILARNITVVLAPEEREIKKPLKSLSDLKTGEKAEVVSISRACRGTQRRRLMDLGIVPGTIISMEMISAGGDPKAFNVRGAILALRTPAG